MKCYVDMVNMNAEKNKITLDRIEPWSGEAINQSTVKFHGMAGITLTSCGSRKKKLSLCYLLWLSCRTVKASAGLAGDMGAVC